MPRDKAIDTPEELAELFENYKTWAGENPYKWHDFVGKDAEEVWKERQRPITWIGFEAYLCKQKIVTHLGHYEQNTGGSYTEYLPIIRAIKKECSEDVISGALAGVYNQNIAARLEGLKDQQDINLNDTRKSTAELFPLDEPNKTEENT